MGESPTWKKPSDVMRIHRRKSLLLSSKAANSKCQKDATQNLLAAAGVDGMSQNSLKRKNPFSYRVAPIKRMSMDDMNFRSDSNENSSTDELQGIPLTESSQGMSLFKCLTESDAGDIKTSSSEAVVEVSLIAEFGSKVDNGVDETDHTNDKLLEIFSVSTNEKINTKTQTIPSDWSLRTKARFISSTPFTCTSLLRSVDEALGTTAFVQNIHAPLSGEQAAADGSVAKQLFQRHLMFWLHPNIPWMQTFPRIVSSNKQMQTGSGMTESVRAALQTDWSESMNSAYQNIRVGLCSYMFICCHHLTILFRASGTSGSHVTAVMTPTTRGLRESLRSEGIEFQLPLHKDAKMNRNLSEGSSQLDIVGENALGGGVEEKEENDKDEAFTDESAVTWLEDLGLDRKRYRSVEPSKVKDQRDRFREIDHRPESTVLVEGGADVQAFFNYLLNCSSLTPSTGVQAGLPPTILSPIAFKGASLQSLKVRQGSILRPDSRGQQHSAHSVEITGPLMPQSLFGLVQLFSQTQPEFTATFSVHEPTVPFNCDLGYDDEQCDGLIVDRKTVFGSGVHVASLGKTAVRELTFGKGLFDCAVY